MPPAVSVAQTGSDGVSSFFCRARFDDSYPA